MIKLSNQALIELKKKLTRGSPEKIRKRLLSKGITHCKQYISSSLNPNHKDYNQDIIEEALSLVEEEARQLYDLNLRIEFLKDPTL
jgi:hypothetical protein